MGKHAIIVIKNDKGEYLQVFDKKWDSYLFINCKVNNEKDIIKIEKEINDKLGIKSANIIYKFDKIHTKFSVSDKIMKEYHHYFYKVIVKEFPKFMVNKSFKNNNFIFKWFTFDELLNDKKIKEVNSDIVNFIKMEGM